MAVFRRGVHCVVVVVLICWLEGVVMAINLDVSTPLIKTSPGDTSKDRFGFSVTLHHITPPVAGNFQSFLSSARIIVGAPHGTFPGGVPNLRGGFEEFNTGLVYQCPVSPEACYGVLGNGQGFDRRLFDGYSNTDSENKTGQLMGAVLYSEGDFFVACAPLYVVFGPPDPNIISYDDSRPVGRCFLSRRSLQDFTLIMPCDGTTVGNSPTATFNSNGHCLSGFSAAIIEQDINNVSSIILGAPGRSKEIGQLFYYTDDSDGNITLAGESSNHVDRFEQFLGIDGIASTTGYITSDKKLDIISGAPRNNGQFIFGAVRVRTQANKTASDPVIELMGNQNGEQFGTALGTADLNNDGYDELLVGAPIYTTTSILEAGRVYVYENLQGSLNNTPIILEGNSIQSRFGSSIVNLGDINGDNYDDIVIGAPYENNSAGGNTSGTIYVYHGRGSESGLISRSPDLVLTAQNITSRVPDLSVLKGFGFSLSSRDIDGNQYNDLLVGAHLTGNAVLIRSFSMANVTVAVTSSVDKVQVDDAAVSATATFIITVCASYSGRGLGNRSLSTSLEVKETGSFSRVLFRQNGKDVEVFDSAFMFATTTQQSCINISALTKPIGQLSQQRNFLSPINISAEFSALPRTSSEYSNGSPVPLVDYRDIPLLTVAGNTSVNVIPVVACGDNSITGRPCMPDLTVSLNDVVYLDSSGRPYNGSVAVAGQFNSLRIDLNYSNIGEDPALGGQIEFNLPEGYSFQRAIVITTNQDISCREESSRMYRCMLSSYIPPLKQSSRAAPSEAEVSLTWLYTGSALIGNEPPQTSNIVISTSDQESNTNNNDLVGGPVTIQYAAISDFEVSSLLFNLTVPMYRHVTTVEDNPTIVRLGRTVQLALRAVNRGPSNSPSAIVEIFIPTNDTSTRFFIYPYRATAIQNGINIGSNCDFSGINPQRLSQGDASSSPRKRRSAVHKRQVDRAMADSRVSQDQVKNCSNPATRALGICTRISCVLNNFISSQALEIGVEAALADKYFRNESDPFVFIAYASIRGNDSFVSDNMPLNNELATDPYTVTLAVAVTTTNLPIWIPILSAVVIVIFFIILFIILYCLGCYRRRKKQEAEEDDDDFPAGPKVSLDTDEKQKTEDNLPDNDVDGAIADDIGDASDLQDGKDIQKSEETDETSL